MNLRDALVFFRRRPDPRATGEVLEESPHVVGAPSGGGIVGTAGLAFEEGVEAATDDLNSFKAPPDPAP
jgi:hypothetical protein